MAGGPEWSNEELNYIRNVYPEHGLIGCLPLLPARSKGAIIQKAADLRVRRRLKEPVDALKSALIKKGYNVVSSARTSIYAEKDGLRVAGNWNNNVVSVLDGEHSFIFTPSQECWRNTEKLERKIEEWEQKLRCTA